LIEHVACDEFSKVGASLSHFQAKFGDGPKTKFVVLMMLNNFD
jgi:hypothetical protein